MRRGKTKPLNYDRLIGYMEKASGKKYQADDCTKLVELIRYVHMRHESRLSDQVPHFRANLHELEPHLTQVIKMLKRAPNSFQLLAMLNQRTGRSTWGVDPFVRTSKRYNALLSDLRSIRRAVRKTPPPPEPAPGRPSSTTLLRQLAKDTSDVWTKMTGEKFKQNWQGKGRGTWGPKSPAARFVYDIVENIDSYNIGRLRKVMEAIANSDPATSRKER